MACEKEKKRFLRMALLDLSEHLGDMINEMFGSIYDYYDADEELENLNAKGGMEYNVGFVNGVRWAINTIDKWLDE